MQAPVPIFYDSSIRRYFFAREINDWRTVYITSASGGLTTIWDPAAGKQVCIKKIIFNASSDYAGGAGTYGQAFNLYDVTASRNVVDFVVSSGAFATIGQPIIQVFDFDNGLVFPVDHVLVIGRNTALTAGSVTVTAFGCEL